MCVCVCVCVCVFVCVKPPVVFYWPFNAVLLLQFFVHALVVFVYCVCFWPDAICKIPFIFLPLLLV